MIKGKNARVALLSTVSRAVRLLTAPVTLLIISHKLSSEEMAFYYTFFSLIAMQQLAELGIGHVMRQSISHAYRECGGEWDERSKQEIKSYHNLSKIWFLFVGVFIVFVIGVCGYYYLNSSNSSIDWTLPWVVLILSTAVSTQLVPTQILLESTQNQESVFNIALWSGLSGSVSLWISISNDFGLYSLSVSTITISLVTTLMLIVTKNITNELREVKPIYGTTETFKISSSLLARVSTVWAFGFLFWNSFNIVTFAILPAHEAGKIIFGIAVARAGFGIAESIIQGQMSIFSNMISMGERKKSYNVFKKYTSISGLLLVSGYGFLLLIWELFPNFYIFEKLPEIFHMIQIMLWFVMTQRMTNYNNYVRCFKIEPFVVSSCIMYVLTPICFYISLTSFQKYAFVTNSILIGLTLIYNNKIYKKYRE